MNTNTMELNTNEMELVNGGCLKSDSQRMNRDKLTDKSDVNNFGTIVRILGKTACDWITGLFD